jgi:hypothetical protein
MTGAINAIVIPPSEFREILSLRMTNLLTPSRHLPPGKKSHVSPLFFFWVVMLQPQHCRDPFPSAEQLRAKTDKTMVGVVVAGHREFLRQGQKRAGAK